MKKVYIVVSEWAGIEILETGFSVNGAFLDKKKAIECYHKIIKEELDNSHLACSSNLEIEEEKENYRYAMWEKENYFDEHFTIEIVEKFLEPQNKNNNLNKFIDILEDKKTENLEDVEEFTEDSFENGWNSAFEMAVLLAEENSNLFE